MGMTGTAQQDNDRKIGIRRLRAALKDAKAVVIGAGAGLSTSAGYAYSGARFQKYFLDFSEKYGFSDMYAGGFYSYPTLTEFWAYWSRNIYINQYMPPPKPVYNKLLALVKDKDYFVITTNVDHCFQRAGFLKHRLFYTQGDYGLLQCRKPCHSATYDNEEIVRRMVTAQGYTVGEEGALLPPAGASPKMTVPEELVPYCPRCGEPMTTNLRVDNTFVEDEGWHDAAGRYREFLRRYEGEKIVFWELGVGFNTPGIVKIPFWEMTAQNKKAVYVCLNYGEVEAPEEIAARSLCLNSDIGELLNQL